MFKGARGLIATLLGAALIITLAFVYGFRDQKDDAATARAFLGHLTADEIPQAYALLHRSITDTLPQNNLRSQVRGLQPFETIAFPSISFSNVNGNRTTEFSGTGTTSGGCESDLAIILRDGAISYFNIEPLCIEAGTDA